VVASLACARRFLQGGTVRAAGAVAAIVDAVDGELGRHAARVALAGHAELACRLMAGLSAEQLIGG